MISDPRAGGSRESFRRRAGRTLEKKLFQKEKQRDFITTVEVYTIGNSKGRNDIDACRGASRRGCPC